MTKDSSITISIVLSPVWDSVRPGTGQEGKIGLNLRVRFLFIVYLFVGACVP